MKKSSGIGGQAVLEGVMMKYKSDYAVAVRKPDGGINVIHGKCKSITGKSVFFRLPIIRGVVSFVESLILGMSTLTYSADFYEEEEEAGLKARDKKENGDSRDKDKNSNKNIETIFMFAFSVILALGVFVALPFFLSQLLNPLVESASVLAIIEGIIRIVLFTGYIFAISFVSDIKRVFMYHGAEHKSINCVENGLELTVENVRTQSKHHKRCGTSFMLFVMLISIICFVFIHFENIWLRMVSRILLVPVIAGISYEFIQFAGNTDNKIVSFLSIPGMLLQRLTTKEPDDKMIEVAIASIEEIFDWRSYQVHLISVKERQQAEKAKKGKPGGQGREMPGKPPKKTRAQIREELLERERENKKRADERARMLKEMEEKEAELERVAEEARKRKEARHAVTINTDVPDEALTGLDHYLDNRDKENKLQDTRDGKKNAARKDKGAKVINLSDYK